MDRRYKRLAKLIALFLVVGAKGQSSHRSDARQLLTMRHKKQDIRFRSYGIPWMCLLLMFMCIFIIGCTVGPKYVSPDIEVPFEWDKDCSQQFEKSSIDSYCWWESLNDPLLNSLIKRASTQNLDLQIAMTRIAEARLNLKGGLATLLPHLDGSCTYSYVNNSQRILKKIVGDCEDRKHNKHSNLNLFEVGFDVEWEADLFGLNTHQTAALHALVESSQEEFSDVWVTLSAEIARSYVELRGTQQQLTLIEYKIEAQKETRELTESLINGGFIGTLDQIQVEEELNLLIAQKPQLEFSIHKNIYTLSILLGQFPADLFCELSSPGAIPDLPSDRPIGIPSELLRRRPDIRKAERDLAAATEEVGTAIAALFPRISLTGFIGDLTSFCSNGSLVGFGGSQLLLPIFNSKMLKQDIDLNTLKAEKAFFQYQKIILSALEEVEASIAAFHYELEKKEYLESVKNSSQWAYFLSLELYQNGLKNYLEVQLAHRSFLAAEETFLQTQVNLIIHYISLYKALGGSVDIFNCVEAK